VVIDAWLCGAYYLRALNRMGAGDADNDYQWADLSAAPQRGLPCGASARAAIQSCGSTLNAVIHFSC
jgi:hypothetical protein